MINKDYLKQTIKIRIKYLQNIRKMFKGPSRRSLNSSRNYIFIFFAADYNNLGDLAITYAQEEFIRNSITTNDTEIIKVFESETYLWVKEIRKLPVSHVLITLIGGGNNGSLYEFIEEPRRFILKALKKYKIVSFPQTVIFENTLKALPYKQEFNKLCERCCNLTLVAREQMSYSFYRQIKNVEVLLTPDIVFSLTPLQYQTKRHGIAFIFRNDKEKALKPELQEQLIHLARNQYNNLFFWDTCDIHYQNNNGKDLLDAFLKKLQTVQMAVTDRLHGMILCYISHTPCIVIDNNNGKIKATFDTWMGKQNFVKMFDTQDDIFVYQALLKELAALDHKFVRNMEKEFDKLKEILH